MSDIFHSLYFIISSFYRAKKASLRTKKMMEKERREMVKSIFNRKRLTIEEVEDLKRKALKAKI